jgi:Interferon-induced transmembrane protein
MTSGPDSAEGSSPSSFDQPWAGAPGSGTPGYGAPDPGLPGYGTTGYGTPGFGVPPAGQRPPTYLIWARVAAVGGVLFNLILGLPSALIAQHHGRQVRIQWEAGNQPGALSASRKARTWSIVATVLDALGIVLVVVVVISSAGSASNFNTPSVVAASIKTQLQKRISDPSSQFYVPGLKVTSVVCTSVSTNTDHCVDYFSNGETASETAVISNNGQSYVTH